MINKITLHNFKAYKDQVFDLANLTIFCGTNSVGKSTAIQAISVPIQSLFENAVSLNGALVELGYLNDVHHQGADDESLEIKLQIGTDSVSWGYKDIGSQESIKHLTELEPVPESLRGYLNKIVNNLQYLQAERFGPKINYELAKSDLFHEDWLGAKGEFTSEFLSRASVSRRLFVGGKDESGSTEGDPRLHPAEKQGALGKQIDAWLSEISPGISVTSRLFEDASTSVNIFEQNGNKSLKPHNVGFGVSYTLSIITALLYARPGALVIVENPEAHLHPKGQSYLGRLIALTAQAGVQVIIETHSDHLINGIRLMPRLGKVDSEKIKIYQVVANSANKNSEAIAISVNEQGELSDWPEQFFDQQIIDMDILMSGKEHEDKNRPF